MTLVIKGRIVPMDRDAPDAEFDGRVFIDPSGTIERVTKATDPAPAGFNAAPVIDVGNAFVVPGLIDLHNHIGYNTLPLWTEPTQKVPFAHHDSWPRAKSYRASITLPSNALVKAAPEALLAHVQLRALVGGTTSIQGWPSANREFVEVLRDIDDETVGGTDHTLILTSTLTLEALELAKRAQAIKKGKGFIYHCAEGQTSSLVAREFIDAANAGCLDKTFIGIHCSAIPAADWARWDKNKSGAIVWSPFSNLWLYGMTADIAAARKQHVSICLGSDWGPSGTKNVLGEVKVAKLASQSLGLGLSDRALVEMLTTNPGDVLSRCWKKGVGRLAAGAFGDVTVFRPKGTKKVWSQIVEATEREVMLAVYAGIPRYGDDALMTTAGLGPSATITISGRKRRFVISNPDPKQKGKPWTLKEITGALNEVRKNPKKALERAEAKSRAFAGPMDSAERPLELVLDMPGAEAAFAGDILDHADEIVIPPLPSLVHDDAFFRAVKKNAFHGGLLDGLAGFYA